MSDTTTLTQLTAEIAAAFVSNNRIGVNEIGGLIGSVHEALAGLGGEPAAPAPEYVAAVTARKSLSDPTRIISMIDGKPYSSLKRHLTSHGLTPDEYRQRYNLPASYPMVAPAYSELRKTLAKKLGLGRKPKAESAAPEPAAEAVVVAAPAEAPAEAPAPKRGRKSAAPKVAAPAVAEVTEPVAEVVAAPKRARKPKAAAAPVEEADAAAPAPAAKRGRKPKAVD